MVGKLRRVLLAECGAELAGFLEILAGFFRLVLLSRQQGEIQVGRGVTRVQRHGLLVGLPGLFWLPRLFESNPLVVIKTGSR